MKLSRVVMTVLLAGTCLFQTQAADAGRIFRSAVYPGMGQLGDGQTIKGLGFMGLETILLTLAVTEATRSNAQARNTEYLQVKYQMAETFEERQQQFTNWQESFDKANQSSTRTMIYGGAAGLVWVLSIADAFLFPPRDDGQASVLEEITNSTLVTVAPGKSQITYQLRF